jgi:hypothetical protein
MLAFRARLMLTGPLVLALGVDGVLPDQGVRTGFLLGRDMRWEGRTVGPPVAIGVLAHDSADDLVPALHEPQHQLFARRRDYLIHIGSLPANSRRNDSHCSFRSNFMACFSLYAYGDFACT